VIEDNPDRLLSLGYSASLTPAVMKNVMACDTMLMRGREGHNRSRWIVEILTGQRVNEEGEEGRRWLSFSWD
jgi:pimeloyl-CoA synthetase